MILLLSVFKVGKIQVNTNVNITLCEIKLT